MSLISEYSYNKRKLVTGINYDEVADPSGQPNTFLPTADATFEYDELGNRVLMDDGPGQVTYAYDALGRMQSETRFFAEISKSYSLTYGFNLAGQVTQLNFVSPSFPNDNVTTNYQRDAAGRLIGVTGAPYAGGNTQYASQVSYRAHGALRTMTYGTTHNTSGTYTARMQLKTLELKRSSNNEMIVNKAYHYYNDGRLKYAGDALHPEFARAYQYDHAERLSESWTGSQATNFFNGNPVGNAVVPYHQAFTYDAWDNRSTHTGKIWSSPVTETESYDAKTSRHTGWQYDNAGYVLNDSLNQLTYNAAGHNTYNMQGNAKATQAMDGDGLVARQDPNTNQPHFFINSSVLGGKVIAEVTGINGGPFLQGNRTESNVYFGETLLATQYVNTIVGGSIQSVVWQNLDPLTGTKVTLQSDKPSFGRTEPDSHAINVDLIDPATLPPPEPEPEEPSYSGAPPNSEPWNPNKPVYYVNGIATPERIALHLLNIGGATLDPKFRQDVSTLSRAGITGHWKHKLVYGEGIPKGPGELHGSGNWGPVSEWVTNDTPWLGYAGTWQQNGGQQSRVGKVLDNIQTGLDVIGLCPGFGEFADCANGLICLGREDYIGAGLSFGAMVPFIGWGATAGKFGKTATHLVDPSTIRFSQPTVSRNFSDGRMINDTIAGLRSGSTKVTDIPTIRVVEYDGQLITLDNRRLLAFDQADISVIPVQKVSLADPLIAKEFRKKNKPILGGNMIVVINSRNDKSCAMALLRGFNMFKRR